MIPADTDWFFSARPAWPWSVYPGGWFLLGCVAALLVALTLWAYLRHPLASRGRVLLILGLRLAALAIALTTAARPSVGLQEEPKVPSSLLVGIDVSESMTIRDEFNSLSRIEAVRKILERCEPALEELRANQNVNVVFYGFGSPQFGEAANRYDPAAPADGKRSDYGTYLNRTLEKWQPERFIRGHLVIGDGIDNGTAFAALGEASRWRGTAPVHTFAVGNDKTDAQARDVAIVAVSADPSPVPIKNDLVIKVVVNAAGFVGAKVPVRVLFNGEQVAKEEATLAKAVGNEVLIPVKAPDKPGEVRVTVEIPVDKVPGDVAPQNNVIETYLTVSKEGVRILLVDRLRPENAQLRRALQGDKRFDVALAFRQGEEAPSPSDRELFDFDSKAYDVIILGNVSAKQLRAVDPRLPEKLKEQVTRKGAGLVMIGGDASFGGTPGRPLDDGWTGTAVEEILPVSLRKFPPVPDALFRGEDKRFQTVPTLEGMKFFGKVAATDEASRALWDRLNDAKSITRMTAVAKLGEPKPGAVVYATTSDELRSVTPAGSQRADQVKPPYLLVGWEQGETNNKGRVLAFAGYDTFNWKLLGLRQKPPARDGQELHAQFWRRLVLWAAHQEEDDGAAYARPEFRRLPIGGKQSVKVGLRSPGGADVPGAKLRVRIALPGQKPEEAAERPVIVDPNGGAKVLFDPPAPGEYIVTLSATGTDAAGKEIKGDAQARFLAYPDVSDEMVRAAAEPDFLAKLAAAGNGKAYRLDDLPGFLKELSGQPLDAIKPRPRYVPDWRRNHSHGFLPGWLVAFVAVLGAEWALRRLWGLV